MGASIQQCHEQQKNAYVLQTYVVRTIHVYVEKCTSTRGHGIGGLLANTVYCLKLEVTVSVLLLTTPFQRGVTDSGQLLGILRVLTR